jgi:hypothetical protein
LKAGADGLSAALVCAPCDLPSTVIPMATVVHCKKAPKGGFVYIGRPHVLGNPFPLDDPKDAEKRALVIEQYRVWFLERVENDDSFRAAVEAVRGRDLGCWCVPRACHGDVILEWLEEHPEQ